MPIPSTRHALRTRKYMSTMYILVTFHQSLDRLYRKVAGGTVFDRRVQAVEPPSWDIIAPPFTLSCVQGINSDRIHPLCRSECPGRRCI